MILKTTFNKIVLTGLSICLATSSYAGFLDKLKDKAVNQVKNKTERSVEREMEKQIDALIPSFERAEPVALNENYDVRPEPGVLVIYTTQTCGYCIEAINWLKDNHVNYREYDVVHHPKGKLDYKLLNGRGVPIILMGDERMNGFSATAVKRMIANQEAIARQETPLINNVD